MTGFMRLLLVALASFFINHASAANAAPSAGAGASAIEQAAEKIDPYVARFGRTRPVIAVLGENEGTVLPDYAIPYGVLSQSGVADVVSLATKAGVLKLPPLQINPDSSVSEFDRRYPDGADYVIVPAMGKRDDPTLIAWVIAQAAKGATMVSICNGSLVLAQAGLTRGHRATGHWSTHRARVKDFPDTRWAANTRYVADRKIVSSAGITAAIPVSLALVEAIGGTQRAQALAEQLGVGYWGPRHNSDAFKFKAGDFARLGGTFLQGRDDIGVPVAAGVDEIALSLTAEAYWTTRRSNVYAVAGSAAPVKTRNGLMLVPDLVAGQGKQMDLMLPEFDATPSAHALEKVLKDISVKYGAPAARFVTLDWEYEWQGK